MGSKYTSQSQSGYNSNPPPDDGSKGANNLITWSNTKTKIGDPLLTLAQNINSALVTALDFGSRTVSASDIISASDNMKTVECTAVLTETLPTAANVGSGFLVNILNTSSGVVTINLQTATDTLNGAANGTIALQSGQAIFLKTNTAANGYFTVSLYGGSSQGISNVRQVTLGGPTDVSGNPNYLPYSATGLNLTSVNIGLNSTLTANVTTPVASPGVVGWPGHPLVIGQAISFTTSGALPTGLTVGITYYVISSGFTANSFEVSTTPTGAAINFTGSTSGQSVCWGGESNPLIVCAQAGNGQNGQNNVIGVTNNNLTWSNLANNTTNYLYVTIANGALTTNYATLVPVVEYESITKPSTTNGQITVNVSTGNTYLGNGTSAVKTSLVVLGTAVTSGGNITSTTQYKYGKFFEAINDSIQTFTVSGTWTKPLFLIGNEEVEIELWGAGGAGGHGGGPGGSGGTGGGGGAFQKYRMFASSLPSTVTVTVGTGGTATGGTGNSGGNTTFIGTGVSLSAAGGTGGAAGGGAVGVGGALVSGAATIGIDGGNGGTAGSLPIFAASGTNGGNNVLAHGGGGGASTGTLEDPGGNGGNGGADGSNGGDGSFPGGGSGGGGATGGAAGAGANGKCKVTIYKVA